MIKINSYLIVVLITITYCCCSTIDDVNMQQLNKSINDDIFSRGQENITNESSIVGRTFGAIRRLKMAIPVIMYKLGVVTTMLGFLTLFTIKGVIIGVIILIIQLSAGLSKLHSSKNHHDHHQEWEPEIWPNKLPQNVHVHVHGQNTGGHYSHLPEHHSPSIWDRDRVDMPTKSNLNLFASLTPYSSYINYKNRNTNLINNKIDDDLLIKLNEYNEIKKLRELRDSLYQQVI